MICRVSSSVVSNSGAWMDQQLVHEVVSALAEIYGVLDERRRDCDPRVREGSILIDRKVAFVDQRLTGHKAPEANQEFITDLTNQICWSPQTVYQFSLSDNSILVFNLAESVIDLTPTTKEMAQKWDEVERFVAARTTSGAKTTGNGDADVLPPPGWEDDPLVMESLLPPFYLPADYDGVDPVFLQIVLGHPLRPVLLMPTNTTPVRVGAEGDDAWPLYAWPTDIIVWWQDSPDEEFNKAAERALDKLGAQPVSAVEIEGEERIFYQLLETWHFGMSEDDQPILEAFFEEEEKIDDDLTYVPSVAEVKAEIREAKLPKELIEYDKSRGLEAASADPFVPEIEEEVDFEEPELRLVDGLGYDKLRRRSNIL